MLFFKRKKNDKPVNRVDKSVKKVGPLVKKMTTEELFGTLEIMAHLSTLYGATGEAAGIIQAVIEEIRLRPNCGERLVKELSDLCLDGFLDHIYVLVEFFLREAQIETMAAIKVKVANHNLRNWIKFTYLSKLDPEISAMVSKEDIDNIERIFVNACTR